MKTEERFCGEIPLLFCYEADLLLSVGVGTILFFHGLGSSKGDNQKEFESLTREGYLVVSVDAWGHGKRKLADFDQFFSGDKGKGEENLYHAVENTADEISELIDYLEQSGCVGPRGIGIIGISMGAYILYAGATRDSRLKVLCPILGSPFFPEGHLKNPMDHLHLLYPRAILSQNAMEDRSVPYWGAHLFHTQLKYEYRSTPEREKFILFPGEGHFMSGESWDQLWFNVLRWLNRFMAE